MKIIPIDISFPFKLLYLKRFRKIIISLLQAETALYAWTHTNCATLHRKTSYFYCENAEDEFTPSCNMLGYQAKWYYRVVSLKWRNLNIKRYTAYFIENVYENQRTLTIGRRIIVCLVSSLTGLDSEVSGHSKFNIFSCLVTGDQLYGNLSTTVSVLGTNNVNGSN